MSINLEDFFEFGLKEPINKISIYKRRYRL